MKHFRPAGVAGRHAHHLVVREVVQRLRRVARGRVAVAEAAVVARAPRPRAAARRPAQVVAPARVARHLRHCLAL